MFHPQCWPKEAVRWKAEIGEDRCAMRSGCS